MPIVNLNRPGMAIRAESEPHIEVHKFRSGAVAGAAFLAIVLQAFLSYRFARADLLELPFLVTLYFGLSRRNPNTGLLLGMVIGLLQDAVSGVAIGLYGIAKTLVGYGASTFGARLDVDHPISRLLLTFLFFHFHHVVLATVKRLILAEPEVFFSVNLFVASLANAVLALALFSLLDRLRKSS